ncbi:hypothetical protein UFO1_3398 [Pelosinus sp. UFO1]|nr:hypothetical protein UFO1_3398 [Pelosinus sp. UFO1]
MIVHSSNKKRIGYHKSKNIKKLCGGRVAMRQADKQMLE